MTEKVFSIETSKSTLASSRERIKIGFFSLRDLLTAVGKPAERLTDVEVITIDEDDHRMTISFFF